MADGPDEDLDRVRKLLHGAISVARKSIAVVTPYFLPDDTLITALNVAALRGVEVDIFIRSVVTCGLSMGFDCPAMASARARCARLANSASL